jgi:hypothetical protein
LARPKKYHTEEERREANHHYQRKYREVNREKIRARDAERDRKKRTATRVEHKET